jgi:putative sigma-54 modulation protein
MQIQVKGRNVEVTDELIEHVRRRFKTVSRQVSELARLEVEVWEERNPANPDRYVAEATLHLKGALIRSRDASGDLRRSVNLSSEELARQVKRNREKVRRRREARVRRAPSDASASI